MSNPRVHYQVHMGTEMSWCSCKSSTVDLEWNDVGLILELQQNFDLNGLLFSKIVGRKFSLKIFQKTAKDIC